MLKKYKWQLIVTSIIILLPVLAGLILWDKLPETIATHWNASGEADGWSKKWFAVIGLPVFILAVHWLCTVVTLADPRRQNISEKIMTLVLWICPLISIVAGTAVLSTAMGSNWNSSNVAMILVSVMFMVIGNYLPKMQQNYTVGIKLPWTIHDPDNWNATHRICGKLWVAGGIIMLFAMFIGVPEILIAVILFLAVFPVVYSYGYYRKHK